MPSAASGPKKFSLVTTGTALLHVDFLLTGIVMTFLGPMLPILSARWGLSDAESGGLIFAQFFSSMFGMLLSGVLVQRYGYRLTLIVGAVFMAWGMAMLASGPYLLGILSVCILGFGHGVTTPAGNLRTAEIDPQRSASALNVINAVWGIGAMSSSYLLAIAQTRHRPDEFLYGTAFAVFVLLIALLISRFVPDTHVEISATSKAATSAWASPILAVICLLFFVYVGTETSFGGWLATYAHRLQPEEHTFSTITPSFYWGALLAGRSLAPFALRFKSPIAIASSGLVIALSGALVLVSARSVEGVIIGSILAGLGLASIFPISVSLLSNWFGDSTRRNSGAIFGSGNIGGAVLPWFVGKVSDHLGSLRIGLMIPLLGVALMLTFYLATGFSREQFGGNSAPPREIA